MTIVRSALSLLDCHFMILSPLTLCAGAKQRTTWPAPRVVPKKIPLRFPSFPPVSFSTFRNRADRIHHSKVDYKYDIR